MIASIAIGRDGIPPPRINLSFTMQPIVHHSERIGVPKSDKCAARSAQIRSSCPALAFA
jgi:hypothetical protein